MRKAKKVFKKQATNENPHYFIPESVNEASEQRRRRRGARRRIVSAPSITFEHLERLMAERADQPGFPRKASLPNLLSALRSFLGAHALALEHPVGTTLRMGYYKALKQHVAWLQAEGRSFAYIANRKSLLKVWRRLVSVHDQEYAAETKSTTPLQQALQQLFSAGASIKATARELGIPLSTLRRLLNGAKPNSRSMRHLPKLEVFFGMAHGGLTDLVGIGVAARTTSSTPTQRIAYRERLAALRRDRYLLPKNSAGESLISEWTSLLKFKSDLFRVSSTPNPTERRRNDRWRLRVPGLTPRFGGWVDTLNGRPCPSASVAFTMAAQFIGWLSLDQTRGGLGLPSERAQSLGHFANFEYVRGYLEWKISRSGDIPNGGLERMLTLTKNLCHPSQGFLVTRPDIGARVGVTSSEMWATKCRETHESLKLVTRNIAPLIAKGRDPFEPIKAILELENPLKAVVEAIRRLDADRPLTGGTKEAVWARDRLLMALTASNPLRATNLKLLTWRADNTGMLRKHPGGGWHIVIQPAQFKNQSSKACERAYDMPVHEELWSFIEVYLRDYWPMLTRGQSDRVFVSIETPQNLWKSLNRRFEYLTRRYLHGCPGVGPHSFRHIVATALIKRTGGCTAAALVLHDREATVRQHYGHLIGADGARWLAAVLGDAFERR